MTERYIAFDVETPNCANDRMSAIGITVIEDGVIVDDFYSLVNPEARFDYFNVQLTGITPEMAEKAPTFSELWAELEPLMSGGMIWRSAGQWGEFIDENFGGCGRLPGGGEHHCAGKGAQNRVPAAVRHLPCFREGRCQDADLLQGR